MKMRVPISFLLLTTGGVLIWALTPIRQDPPNNNQHQWIEQIGELKNLARDKYASATEYIDLASVADAEQESGAAHLFRALALSERVHEELCAEVVRQHGGHYTPPTKVVILRSITPSNLTRALDRERRHYELYRSGIIERAYDAGNNYIARTLIRIAGCDMRQAELLERLTLRPDSSSYAVCLECGNLWPSNHCDHFCSLCLTPERQFTLVK